MGRVRYASSSRDLDASARAGATPPGHRVRSIRCVYETDAEVVQAVVPKPLEARIQPEVVLCFASLSFGMPSVDAGETRSRELRAASFGVRVDYDDRPGTYLLTMPSSSEAAVVGGRERFGEPKKLATIDFEITPSAGGPAVSASARRRGVTYLAALGRCVEELGPRDFTETGYCFKAFPGCIDANGFDQDPQLVRLEWRHRVERAWRVEGGLELWESPFDPVADLPVRRLVEFAYTEGTVERSGRVLRPVHGDWLLPFIHQRYDAPQTEGVDV